VEFMEGRECSLHGCDVDASGFMTGFMNVGLGSDTNWQITKNTTSTSQKGQSSQDTKQGPTKPRERINKRRRSYKPEYQKFFLLVFLKNRICL